MRVQIPDTTYQREIESRGLVETDKKKAEDYKARARMMQKTQSVQNDINMIKDRLSDIDKLKEDMAEIKNILLGLVK